MALSLQATHNLASSPRRVSIAYCKNTLFNLPICPLRTRMRTPRPVCDLLLGLPSAQPFIARVRVDAEPPAKLPPVDALLHRKADKLTSLIHYRHLSAMAWKAS